MSNFEYLQNENLCTRPHHNNNAIIAICTNKNCKNILCCSTCLQERHQHCKNTLIRFKEMINNNTAISQMDLISFYSTLEKLKILDHKHTANLRCITLAFDHLKARIIAVLDYFKKEILENLNIKLLDLTSNHFKQMKDIIRIPNKISLSDMKESIINFDILVDSKLRSDISNEQKILLNNVLSDATEIDRLYHCDSFNMHNKDMLFDLINRLKIQIACIANDTLIDLDTDIYYPLKSNISTNIPSAKNTRKNIQNILHNNLALKSCLSTINTDYDFTKSEIILKHSFISGKAAYNSIHEKEKKHFLELNCSGCCDNILECRYLCTECTDFVFCEKCFNHVLHEHPLLPIESYRIKRAQEWLNALSL